MIFRELYICKWCDKHLAVIYRNDNGSIKSVDRYCKEYYKITPKLFRHLKSCKKFKEKTYIPDKKIYNVRSGVYVIKKINHGN